MSLQPTHLRLVVSLVLICLFTGPAVLAGPDVPLDSMLVGFRRLNEFVLESLPTLALTFLIVGLVRLLVVLLSVWKPNSGQ